MKKEYFNNIVSLIFLFLFVQIRCINVNGELWLRKSYRPSGPMMVHKTAYVEYVPFGVLGVIAVRRRIF